MKAYRLSIDEENNAEQFWGTNEAKKVWNDLCASCDKNEGDWNLYFKNEADAENALKRLTACPYWNDDVLRDIYNGSIASHPVLGVYDDDVDNDFFDEE